MYKHILVPTDGSKLSLKAAKAAGELARSLKARVTTLYVMEPFSPPMASDAVAYYPAFSARGYETQVRKTAEQALAHARKAIGTVHGKIEGAAVFHRSPWKRSSRRARHASATSS